MAADPRHLRIALAAALSGFALLLPASAQAGLNAPVLLDPAPGASLEALPAFAWSPVAGAEAYEFQLAADRNFNAPVLGRGEGSFTTRNTRATLKKTVPNGTYWWRVRATTRGGDASPWSAPRSFRKAWTAAPSSLSPVPGFPFSFPTLPIRLNWSPVSYAASYLFSLASDPALANIVENQGRPVETWATNYVPTFTLLPQGTYYWNVVPLDSQGNRGSPSGTSSFTWTWPSGTLPSVTDLVAADEFFDPQFSWTPAAGGAPSWALTARTSRGRSTTRKASSTPSSSRHASTRSGSASTPPGTTTGRTSSGFASASRAPDFRHILVANPVNILR